MKKHLRTITRKPASADVWTDTVAPILSTLGTLAGFVLVIVEIAEAAKGGKGPA